MPALMKDVRALIERLAPEPVCDDYIADLLGLAAEQRSDERTGELAGERGFERSVDACALCGETKKGDPAQIHVVGL